MNISFDFDGTVTRYPDLFVAMGRAFRAAGHRVYILTGNRMHTMLNERMNAYPILRDSSWYDDILTFDLATDAERAMLGTVTARQAVGAFKARMCVTHDIAVHFDDDVEHVRYQCTIPVMGVS